VAATAVATTVTAKVDDTGAGALYVAEVEVTLENVPHALPEHPGPVALHATPWFVVSPVKLAVNCNDWPWSMLGGRAGAILTPIGEGDEPRLQPHNNTKTETASASFFIICAFPLP
jgi:hypothetical protein